MGWLGVSGFDNHPIALSMGRYTRHSITLHSISTPIEAKNIVRERAYTLRTTTAIPGTERNGSRMRNIHVWYFCRIVMMRRARFMLRLLRGLLLRKRLSERKKNTANPSAEPDVVANNVSQ